MTTTLPSTNPPRLILITGIMAAGKSTVAQRLAERLPKSVHLRGDLFRRMIVSGQAEMDFELSPEALKQLKLRYHLGVTAAGLYLEAGFWVVYQDIIIGKDLAEAVAALQGYPLHVVVLCPSIEVVAAREAGRGKSGYSSSFTPQMFDQAFRAETPQIGLWLDTSRLTVEETVTYILAHLDQARVSPPEPDPAGEI
jgi:chloramphenicol 3-O-phosphotransferase